METEEEVPTAENHIRRHLKEEEKRCLTIWSSITNHQISRLTLKVTDDFLSCGNLPGRRNVMEHQQQ